jgi:pyruvate formate lyase activating enzyme
MGSAVSPVYAFLKNPSMLDFSGHLAAVFFVSGCNFRCGFCHNPELLHRRRECISWERLSSVCRGFKDNWVDGAVLMGGEPTTAPELPEVIRRFREGGWAVKLDTNGSIPEMIEKCLPRLDYVAMDVKAGPSGYARLTGFKNVAAIRESIAMIKAGARDYEFRTTVVDSFHTDQQMLEIADLIRGARRYVLQPFVPRETIADATVRSQPRTSEARLLAIRNLVADCADEVVVRGDA